MRNVIANLLTSDKKKNYEADSSCKSNSLLVVFNYIRKISLASKRYMPDVRVWGCLMISYLSHSVSLARKS